MAQRAHASITDAAAAACAGVPGVSSIVNGRFKGGYITRHYGRPAQDVHAVQLEKCQSLYMQEVAPFAYDETLAAKIQPVLENMVSGQPGRRAQAVCALKPNTYAASQAWVNGAWAQDVLLTVGADGHWCKHRAQAPRRKRCVAPNA